jgi:transcription initiation factor IIE alpha subunit
VEFLLDRRGSSFRSQDLEEMAGMDRDDVNTVLDFLSERKMISKEKSQIVLEPELQEVLKGFDR